MYHLLYYFYNQILIFEQFESNHLIEYTTNLCYESCLDFRVGLNKCAYFLQLFVGFYFSSGWKLLELKGLLWFVKFQGWNFTPWIFILVHELACTLEILVNNSISSYELRLHQIRDAYLCLIKLLRSYMRLLFDGIFPSSGST